MKTKTHVIILFLFPLLFFRCSSVDSAITTYAAKNFEESMEVVYKESDLKLARQFLSSNMMTIRIVLSKDPDNKKMNLFAARSFGAYAMAFIEETNKERAEKLYQRGLNYAIQSLPDNKKFSTKVSNDTLKTILKKYRKGEVPNLFWLAYNWGKMIMLDPDSPSNLMNLSKVVEIMSRCKELNEEYYFAGVDLFYGLYWTSRPKMLGGNPEKGKKYLKKAFRLNNKKLYLAKYYLAKYYAPRINDEQLFDKLIQDILQFDLDKYPNYRLMNAMAQHKAKQLKSNKKNYF